MKFDRLLKHAKYRFHKKNRSSGIGGGGGGGNSVLVDYQSLRLKYRSIRPSPPIIFLE